MNMDAKYILVSKYAPWTTYLVEKLKGVNDKWECTFSCDERFLSKFKNLEYVFFFHWSDIVDEKIYDKYECILFHTAPLPYFKGGSPIQNQIKCGIVFSSVNAVKMTGDVDSGPIYCCKDITLQGSLEDIWMSIADTAFELIYKIIQNNLYPKHLQKVSGTHLKRIKSNRIDFENLISIKDIYDEIRMRDGYGYQKAFVDLGDFRIEFSRASLRNDAGKISSSKTEIRVDAKIVKKYED